MYNGLKCIYIGRNEFLAYNKQIAGLFNDYRITANATIHQEECRKLTDEETEKLLRALEYLEDVEERQANEDEQRILDNIRLLYPEVQYVIQSLGITAARGRKRQRKKGSKKEKEKVQKQDAEDRVGEQEEASQKDTSSDNEKESPDKNVENEDTPKSAKKGGGWLDFLKRGFEFLKDPDLTPEQRKIKLREKNFNKARMKKVLERVEHLEKKLVDEPGVIEFVDLHMGDGNFDASTLESMSYLLEDKAWLRELDLPDMSRIEDYEERKEKVKKEVSDTGTIGITLDILPDMEDIYKADADDIEEHIRSELDKAGIDEKELTILVDEEKDNEGERIITISGPLIPFTRFVEEYSIQPDDNQLNDDVFKAA